MLKLILVLFAYIISWRHQTQDQDQGQVLSVPLLKMPHVETAACPRKGTWCSGETQLSPSTSSREQPGERDHTSSTRNQRPNLLVTSWQPELNFCFLSLQVIDGSTFFYVLFLNQHLSMPHLPLIFPQYSLPWVQQPNFIPIQICSEALLINMKSLQPS